MFMQPQKDGTFKSIFSSIITKFADFKFLRLLMCVCSNRLEKGIGMSYTVRLILKKYEDVELGTYSYGPDLLPGRIPKGSIIGRYVSIGPGLMMFPSNHPLDSLGTHPVFYHPDHGMVKDIRILRNPVRIEHDVWIGARVTIVAGCGRIGIGAIVGAGSVLTKDVPDFAIVAGVPAKLIRYRFSEEIKKEVLRSEWWKLSIDELSYLISGTFGETFNVKKILEYQLLILNGAHRHNTDGLSLSEN